MEVKDRFIIFLSGNVDFTALRNFAYTEHRTSPECVLLLQSIYTGFVVEHLDVSVSVSKSRIFLWQTPFGKEFAKVIVVGRDQSVP